MSGVPPNFHPLASRPPLRELLDSLHRISLEQEKAGYETGRHFPSLPSDKEVFASQLIALDEDKARDMYLVLRAMGARRVVEAGTSYGVSLLWLLAAVTANEGTSSFAPPHYASLVVGTENEPAKAEIALQHVRQAFGAEPACLNLLVGDINETLPNLDLPNGSVDALLLDIWAPLALPTLKVMLPKLRRGAVVFIDNTKSSEQRYAELLTFTRDPENGFLSSTLPHSCGFEMCVKVT